MGAHSIKVGLNPIFVDAMRRGCGCLGIANLC